MHKEEEERRGREEGKRRRGEREVRGNLRRVQSVVSRIDVDSLMASTKFPLPNLLTLNQR